MLNWLNVRWSKTSTSKTSTSKKEDPEDKDVIKQLKKENKRLAKEVSQLKINLLEYDSAKEELDDIYQRYAKLNKELANKRNFESDINNIQSFVFLSIKMRNLLVECREQMLPVNLGKQIDSVLKEAKELD